MEQKLETFLTLCRTMHYGHAAELLHLSQPAVSKHIQALEAQYGVPLFRYSGRSLKMTPQGKLLEQFATSLRYNEESLLSKFHASPRRLLRIGATKSIGDYILLPEIRNFLHHKENQLEFLVDNTTHLLDLLDRGALDFVILEGIFDKNRYDWFPFRQEPYIGICSPEHAFAHRQVSMEELFSQCLIVREEGSGTRNILEWELAQQGYGIDSFADRICISSFGIIKELVSSNYGISFLYDAVVHQDPKFAQFTCPPLTGSHELSVVFFKNTNAGALAHQFLM